MRKITLLSMGIYFLILLFWLLVIIGMLFASRLSFLTTSQKTINILSWGSIFDTSTLSEFHRRTGIKVNISYYSSNEELLVALKSTKGYGYDLVVPSDYAVEVLKKRCLLKKIDKSRLNFLHSLNPLLMGHFFDVSNDYSLPYMVEFFGLGFSKSYFQGALPNPSWKWIFTNPQTFKIAMVNDAIAAVDLAAYYLYRPAEGRPLARITSDQIQNIKQLLVEQKAWVEAYTDFRPDYFLLTRSVPLIVSQLSSVIRAQEQSSDIGFAIPQEGTFISIENLALPCGSQNDAVYEFINFVYTPKIMLSHFEKLASLPATVNVLPELRFEDGLRDAIVPLLLNRADFEKRILFFAQIMPENTLHDLWVEVKSR